VTELLCFTIGGVAAPGKIGKVDVKFLMGARSETPARRRCRCSNTIALCDTAPRERGNP
jgi:hypothetical protein